MTTQPEQILEDSLITQLVGMDYEKVAVLHTPIACLMRLRTSSSFGNGSSDRLGGIRVQVNNASRVCCQSGSV